MRKTRRYMVLLAQPLRLFGDGLFYTEVGVGTPAQRVAVTVDTGSGNLWLPSANCTAVACRLHRRFDGRRSRSYAPDELDASICISRKPAGVAARPRARPELA